MTNWEGNLINEKKAPAVNTDALRLPEGVF